MIKLIQLYFWLTLALQETKISLKRLKIALFGEGRRKRRPPGGGSDGLSPSVEASLAPTEIPSTPSEAKPSDEGPVAERRSGHGRQGAEMYTGAERVICRYDGLAAGHDCPMCGRGTLYPLLPGAEIRIDGNALLTAVRYELERLRCSVCGQIFTAPLPMEVGKEKYTAWGRAGSRS
jgi:transposase